MFTPRALTPQILPALENSPTVFINGPRQAGKSTLVQTLPGRSWPAGYLTFDDASQLGAAQANPESFLRACQRPQILDEVQMVPDLFRALKMLVDETRIDPTAKANGQFLLTGSANIMALPALADALVGRMVVMTLYPFSALEISTGQGGFLSRLMGNGFKTGRCNSDTPLTKIIQQATFPEISKSDKPARHRWFESYLSTILQRDVRQLADIAKLGVLPNLLRILASRAGCLINAADIGRSIGLNAVTTKNYRILLQMMFLTFDISPWFRNIGKRLVKSPKGYLIDTSLLCHLQQIDLEHVVIADPHVFGHVFENFVATELIKQLSFSSIQAQLLHFRTSDNKEVDFVFEQFNGTLAAIEVKARDAVNIDDFRGLKELEKQAGKDFICGIVLYTGKVRIPFGERLWAIPANELWS